MKLTDKDIGQTFLTRDGESCRVVAKVDHPEYCWVIAHPNKNGVGEFVLTHDENGTEEMLDVGYDMILSPPPEEEERVVWSPSNPTNTPCAIISFSKIDGWDEYRLVKKS